MKKINWDMMTDKFVLIFQDRDWDYLRYSTYPYAEQTVDIIYSVSVTNAPSNESHSLSAIQKELWLLEDSFFAKFCINCDLRRVFGLCQGGFERIVDGGCKLYQYRPELVEYSRNILQIRNTQKIVTAPLNLPPSFVVKSHDCYEKVSQISNYGTFSLAKYNSKLDVLEAVHATNLFSLESENFPNACLGQELKDILYMYSCPENLLRGDLFFKLFFSSEKNFDLHGHPSFCEYDEKDFDYDGELLSDKYLYTPAWFWKKAVENWETEKSVWYSHHSFKFSEIKNNVYGGRSFAVQKDLHDCYVLETNEDFPSTMGEILVQTTVASAYKLVVVKK